MIETPLARATIVITGLLAIALSLGCRRESEQIILAGTLGAFAGTLELLADRHRFSGTFVYEDPAVQTDEVLLRGELIKDELNLVEYGKHSDVSFGTFVGKYSPLEYTGFWHSPDGQHTVPFRFKTQALVGKTTEAKVVYEMTHKFETNALYRGLSATIEGRRYVVFEPESEDDYIGHLFVLATDLNGDGYEEAIISSHGGGNVAPFEHSVYTYDPAVNSFFHVPDFGASFTDPVLEELNGRRCIKIHVDYSQNDAPSISDVTSWYSLEGHNGALIHRIVKLPIPAVVEISVGGDRELLLIDVNQDNHLDTICYNYSVRWDQSWTLLFGGGLVDTTSGWGRRVGLLHSKTNGYFDIVSDLDEVYRWNGKEYVSDRPKEEEEPEED